MSLVLNLCKTPYGKTLGSGDLKEDAKQHTLLQENASLKPPSSVICERKISIVHPWKPTQPNPAYVVQ